MRCDERLYVREKPIVCHVASIARVATRMSSENEGSVPLLRVTARAATMAAMAEAAQIDVARLKRDVISCTGPGKQFTRRALSLAASDGKNPDLVRDLISRGQDRKPSIETVAGLARAMGKSTGDYLSGANVGPEPLSIMVVGSVEAGVWREQEEWPAEKQYPLEVHPSPVPGAERFGLVVEGLSMNKVFPEGTELDCLRVIWKDGGLRPMPGDLVIAQRRRGDLYETTCKRLALNAEGEYELRAESTEPEFAQPIPLGKPDDNYHADDGAEIIGIVNRAYQRHFRRLS